MLSQTSEHAIRALLYLAQRPGGPVPAERIARALGAPANYLAKTLNALAKEGIVASTRGPAGGFRLHRAAERITLAEVDECFREARPGATCLLGDRPCDGRHPCAAHLAWASVCDEIRAPLRRTTLASLLAEPSSEQSTAGAGAGIHGRAARAA